MTVMKAFVLLLLAFPFLAANANTYYFSSNLGNDYRSFSQAQNPSTPWRSLSKLNSIFGSLRPGDKVLLKRGETFYGSIRMKKSGTSGSPIFIGAYGSGAKPVITSLFKVTKWVSKGKGIYESSVLPGTKVNVVLINGAQQELGRYPNSNAANGGYLTFESHYGSTSITDNQLKSFPNWTGADVVIRKKRWIIDRDRITSHSRTKISYKASASYVYVPTDKFGYFITNSIKTLDKLGEWYYNPSTHKLSVYFGSNSPSSYNVQAATADDLIYAERSNYVVLDNLTIKGANANGIYNRFGSYVSVTNCDLSFASNTGVMAFMAEHFKVEGCTITNCNSDGIDLGYSGDYATIRNNKISNTGTFVGMSGSGDRKGIAIHSNGNSTLIENNEIRNTNYTGIYFGGSNTTIRNNYIDKFCYIRDDGGAIYTWGGPGNNVRHLTNRKIIGNIIGNGIGNPNGAYNIWGILVKGIYLDNGAMNVEVTGNTVFNVNDMAMLLNGVKNIKVSSNTFYGSATRHMCFAELSNHPTIRNNSVSNNILFSRTVIENFITKRSQSKDGHLFASISGNHYARPSDKQNDKFLRTVRKVEPNARILSYVDPVRFEYNPTTKSKKITLDANYVDVKNNKYSGSVALKPFTSVILIKTGKSYANKPPKVSITSPAKNTRFQTGTVIRINANATDDDGSIRKVEMYSGSTLLTTKYQRPYTYSLQNAPEGNYTFTARATDNRGNVTTSAGVSISVKSSSFFPTVSITSPTQNASYKGGATINMSANANDRDGSIQKVEFFNGSYLLGTEYYRPYIYSWKNVSNGNYRLTAKATDNSGNVTTSSSVYVSVKSSSYPRVSITNPVANRRYRAGSPINISANASVSDGYIRRVEYYVGNTLLHTEKAPPYSWNWRNVRAGKYTLTAKAIDNNGDWSTSSSVSISVVNISNRSAYTYDSLTEISSSDTGNLETAGLDKPESASVDFHLFPNPAVSTIKVTFNHPKINQKAMLSILSMSGSLLKNLPLTLSGKTVDIDISALRPGTYIMKLTGDRLATSKTFVKMP